MARKHDGDGYSYVDDELAARTERQDEQATARGPGIGRVGQASLRIRKNMAKLRELRLARETEEQGHSTVKAQQKSSLSGEINYLFGSCNNR